MQEKILLREILSYGNKFYILFWIKQGSSTVESDFCSAGLVLMKTLSVQETNILLIGRFTILSSTAGHS